jgi:hypothetical protein
MVEAAKSRDHTGKVGSVQIEPESFPYGGQLGAARGL